MKQLSLLVCFLMLASCRSEVDKCTDAIVKMNSPYKNEEDRNGMEAGARFECLRAQAGKE